MLEFPQYLSQSFWYKLNIPYNNWKDFFFTALERLIPITMTTNRRQSSLNNTTIVNLDSRSLGRLKESFIIIQISITPHSNSLESFLHIYLLLHFTFFYHHLSPY